MSAIRLEDSKDGFNQEQPSSSTSASNIEVQKPEVIDDRALWSTDNRESLSKRIPGR